MYGLWGLKVFLRPGGGTSTGRLHRNDPRSVRGILWIENGDATFRAGSRARPSARSRTGSCL